MRPRSPLNLVQMPANENSGRSSPGADHSTSFFLVPRFGSGAYSAKLLAGTRHGFSGLSHIRSAGDARLCEELAACPSRLVLLHLGFITISNMRRRNEAVLLL
jgi:hypothetical protein